MPERPPWLHARGRLDAVVVVADLAAEVASALVPAGLELRPQALTPAGRHPVILLFGEHSRVGFPGLGFGLRYRELVIALPFVRPRGGPPGPFCHLPLLLLDRRLPTWLGRWLYGFAKRHATIRRSAISFDAIGRSDGSWLFAARWRASGAALDLGPVRGLFEQPLIAHGAGARWRYSRFDFGFERARLGAVEVEVSVHPGLLAGLPAGPLRPARSFRLETAWTLARLRPPDARQP